MNLPALSESNTRLRLFFYIGWFVLGIIQAWSMDLIHDEAFYWFCSQNLSWGYLEQPPMVNLLIYIGNLIIPNELGARLLFVLMHTVTIYLLERILQPRNFPLFITIVLSVAVLSIGGFLAMPDNALIFFTATFFILYKRYLDEDKLLLALLLGLNIAAILYSKYYGLLVIILVVASNTALFKRRSFYAIAVISLVLLLPAILWQYDHGFISLRYHFLDKLTQPYALSHSSNYLIGQVLFLGPLIGVILVFSAHKFKPKDQFDNALRYTLIGVLVFFLLATFRFEVLPHWTSAAIIPLVLLSYKRLDVGSKATKWVFYLFPLNVLIVIVIRLYFVIDFVPQSFGLKMEYHKWGLWGEEMDRISEGRPLVFLDDDIVKYNYYSKNTAHALSYIAGAPSQYDLWDSEQALQGQGVMLISKNRLDISTDSFTSVLGRMYYFRHIENFRSYSKIRILSNMHDLKARGGEKIIMPVRMVDLYGHKIAEVVDPSVFVSYYIFSEGKLVRSGKSNVSTRELQDNNEWVNLTVEAPDKLGSYEIRLSVSQEWMPPTINSNIIHLQVEPTN